MHTVFNNAKSIAWPEMINRIKIIYIINKLMNAKALDTFSRSNRTQSTCPS